MKDSLVEKIAREFRLLRCLDLSYCDDVGNKAGFSISQYCDSMVFKELRLNGCRKVTDALLKALMSKYSTAMESPEPTEKT